MHQMMALLWCISEEPLFIYYLGNIYNFSAFEITCQKSSCITIGAAQMMDARTKIAVNTKQSGLLC